MLVPYLLGWNFLEVLFLVWPLKRPRFVSQVDFEFSLFVIGPHDWCQVHAAIVFVLSHTHYGN
jgi:hypothetical protein